MRHGSLRPFAYPGLWISVWCLGWLLCIALSLVTPPDLPPVPPLSDKLGHLIAYASLAVWAVQLFATRRALLTSLLALVALGIALEFAQGALTVTRLRDPLDALANTLGVVLGGLLFLTPLRCALLRTEARWMRLSSQPRDP